MIIKQADDKTAEIKTLQSLLAHPAANAETKRKIEQELRNIASGSKGEQDTAFEIDFHYGSSRNWAVIHDLRIEHGGRVAQIDHLLINRLLDVWVCESKRFADGIAINDQGECAMFWRSKPQGVGSPYEQNAKHIAVIKAACDDGAVDLPKRLGFAIKPAFNSLVVISKNARISRPSTKGWWDENLVKADQLRTRIERALDGDNNVLLAAKIVGPDTLEAFARSLASIHVPASFDWHARFGLSKDIRRPAATPPAAVEVAGPDAGPAEGGTRKSKLACVSCGQIVAYAVAKFCWFNKARFGGSVYCMECQKRVSKPT